MPPARLRVMVDSNGDPNYFHAVGLRARNMILRTLEREGTELESFASILDFGCGCGRVARHWAGLRGPHLHGCDYNPELVAWCRESLGFMEARVNGLEPPLPYEDRRFELVYAISVLTHLTEELALAWLDELARVLRPGGRLLVTTHGAPHRHRLPPARRPAFDRGEPVVLRARSAGMNACAAFHPRSWMEAQLGARFDKVHFYGDGASRPFLQDVYVAQI
jgi:SAM-dependent methyltransferase